MAASVSLERPIDTAPVEEHGWQRVRHIVEAGDEGEAVTLVQEQHSEHSIPTMQLPAGKASPIALDGSGNPPSLTRAGSIMGTPNICRPNSSAVNRGFKIGHLQSGAVAYRMLTGCTPSPAIGRTDQQHAKETPLAIRNSIGECPESRSRRHLSSRQESRRKTPDCRRLRVVTESRLRRQRHAAESRICSLQREISHVPQDIAGRFHAAHGADPPVQPPRQAARRQSKR